MVCWMTKWCGGCFSGVIDAVVVLWMLHGRGGCCSRVMNVIWCYWCWSGVYGSSMARWMNVLIYRGRESYSGLHCGGAKLTKKMWDWCLQVTNENNNLDGYIKLIEQIFYPEKVCGAEKIWHWRIYLTGTTRNSTPQSHRLQYFLNFVCVIHGGCLVMVKTRFLLMQNIFNKAEKSAL